MSRPILVLVNDRARNASCGNAVDSLRALGLAAIAASPRDPHDANTIIREHRERITAVVVAGGDGSVNAILPAVLESGIPLGILPMGTANDFARTLGLPESLEPACQVIAARKTRTIDVADVNGRFFINAAAIGMPCEMAADTSHEAKGVFGPLASLLLVHRLAKYARPFRAQFSYDGRSESMLTNAILIGNGRYNGGFPVKYEAVDDGLLNITVSTAKNSLETAGAILSAWRRSRPRFKHLIEFDARELYIETGLPRQVSADGDVVSTTPATFRIHPAALRVFVS